MKKIIIGALTLVLINSVFFSCSKDDEGYSLGDIWISLGLIETTNTTYGFEVHCDNGDTLIPISSSLHHFHPEDSLRVLINYTILDEVDNAQKKFWVAIHDLHKVLFKYPIALTAENNDSIGNDPIVLDDIWIVNNMLNVEFRYRGSVMTHYINLTYTDKNVNEPLQFEFRHNANHDDDDYLFQGLVTFDLSTMQREGQDSVAYIISSTDFDGEIKTFEGVYRY